MPDLYMDVDTAVYIPANIVPLVDYTDGKTLESVLDMSGNQVSWNFVTTAGARTRTDVTLVDGSGNDYYWRKDGEGMYAVYVPASGGASVNNDTEGVGWISSTTDMSGNSYPFRGPTIGFRSAALNNALMDTDNLFDASGNIKTNVEGSVGSMADVTTLKGYYDASGNLIGNVEGSVASVANITPDASGNIPADMVKVSGDATAADNFETMLDGTGGQTLSLSNLVVTAASGAAIQATGASGSAGISAASAGGNADGILAAARGTGSGIKATGGTGGNGIYGLGGSVSGAGMWVAASAIGNGFLASGSGGYNGLLAQGNGAAAGIRADAGATGEGLVLTGGGTSGNGITITTTKGHGISVTGSDASGNKDGIIAVGARYDINADIHGSIDGAPTTYFDASGNLIGNVEGSVGSVPNSSGMTTLLTYFDASGNVIGNVEGSVGSVPNSSGTTSLVGFFDASGNLIGNVEGSVGSVSDSSGTTTLLTYFDASGNLIGNIEGSVAQIAASGITIQSMATGAIGPNIITNTARAQIADDVWDESIVGHTTSPSTGYYLNSGASIPSGWTAVTNASLDSSGNAIGICQDEHATPISGATITAYLLADTTRLTPKSSATSDADGTFTIYLEPAATYTLVFQADGQEEATETVVVA